MRGPSEEEEEEDGDAKIGGGVASEEPPRRTPTGSEETRARAMGWIGGGSTSRACGEFYGDFGGSGRRGSVDGVVFTVSDSDATCLSFELWLQNPRGTFAGPPLNTYWLKGNVRA